MKHSVDRILTTHAGSLPRPPELLDLVKNGDSAFEQGTNYDLLRNAVSEIVRRRVALGIDVIDDGEYGKPSFVSYINERLGGYEVDTRAGPRNQWLSSREGWSFPEFYAQTHPASAHTHMICTGPITYKGHSQLKRDIANLKAALQGVAIEEVFMPAISPSNIEDWQKNAYYKSQEEYVFAIAEAMREEYKAIVNAGFLVQIDDPRLVTYYIIHPEASIEDCRKWAELRIAALNHALRDIPPEKIRFHTVTASIWVRGFTTRSSKTSSTSFSRSAPAPIRLRPQTRGLNTSGKSGRTSSFRTEKSSFRESSRTRPSLSSIRSW
jgi:5-methyltetrahydropteroyltriglutamate--homocysteine methyltransferase